MAKGSPISELTIRGFKSIRNLDKFKLKNLNILIGSNGTGKSNFISFFRMLNEMIPNNSNESGRLQSFITLQGGADRILSYGIKETSQIYSLIQFGCNDYSFELAPTVDDKLMFSSEVVSFFPSSGGNPFYNFGAGHFESLLKDKAIELNDNSKIVSSYCYDSISNWRVYHFHDTSETAGVKRFCSVEDISYLRSDAQNLAAFLYDMKQFNNDDYYNIIKVIRLALPFFDNFVLEPRNKPNSDDQQIRLLWKQKDSDYPLWPSQLSDGSLRFICLATALLQPIPPSTIFIDEPELGLHPYAINLLGGLLRSASKRMQVIVSTQSVPLLNEFELEDLVVVEHKDGESIFKRLSTEEYEQWLDDYTIGELWEKNILGGRPRS